jgi:hypothetical protein
VRYDTTIALAIVTLIIGLTIGFLARRKSKEIAFYSFHPPSLFNLGHCCWKPLILALYSKQLLLGLHSKPTSRGIPSRGGINNPYKPI